MKPGERGYTLIELLVAISIMAVASFAAGMAIFQVLKGTEHNNERMTVVRQVHSAGYWISRDAQMAHTIAVNNETPEGFLVLNWTEDTAAEEPVYHSANYSIENITDGIGKLKRKHWSSAGADEEVLIAQHIYYDSGDTDNTTQASYDSRVLTVQLTAIFDETWETRECKIRTRINVY